MNTQRPRLDGRPFPGVMAYTYREHQADFLAAGIQVFRLSLPVGWVGPDRYDYADGDEVAAAFCGADPSVRLFPLLWLDGPETKWWELEHPDEVAIAIDRATGAVRREHPNVPNYARPGQDFTPVGDLFDRHHQGTPCLHSFASARWQAEAAEALGRAIAHYESAFPGRFAGYYVCAGLSYEWFNWGNYTDDLLFDYSAPMRRYFRGWLERRYRTPAALSDAWRRPVGGFASVEPPPPAERPARDAAPLLDPRTHTPAADFAAALADAQADAFLALCRRARAAAAPGHWIGGFFGYWWTQTHAPGPARSGHLALQRVLESPDVDFVGSPYDYSNRGVGGVNSAQTMPGSLRAHDKCYINSTDIKLADDTHAWQSFIRVPRTEGEAVELMKRDFAFSLAEGQEQSWVDLFGGAFQRSALRDALARLQRIAVAQSELRVPPRARALVVVDEESLRWTTPNTPLTVPLFGVQKQWHLLRSGFPWTFITLEDFLAGTWPDARLACFVNAFRVDAARAQLLHACLRERRCTAVWNLWPGLLGEHGPDPAGTRALTGFAVRRLEDSAGDWTFQARTPARLVYGTGVDRAEYAARMKHYPDAAAFAGMPRLAIDPAADDAVLADWATEPRAAVARHHRLGFPSVLNCGPFLPAPMWNALGGEAGVHRYTDAGHLVYANDRFLALYTGAEGPCTVRFPAPVRIHDLWSDRALAAEPVESFTVAPGMEKTCLWRLDT
ncbi:MAG TPA: hypothetical protein PKE12_05615 [Kiritimatiellia bacterium]|nr:hypothetical protein [Kiritimatiellia bacterium]